jgi:hypothetical protein
MQLVPAVCGDQGEIWAVGVPEMTWLLFQEWVLVNLDSTSEVEGFLSLMGILRRCFITFLNVSDPHVQMPCIGFRASLGNSDHH